MNCFKTSYFFFGTFAELSEKLIQIISTQNNESFNRTVPTKNPKTHFYSGSESTAFRVASAVAQRNDGVRFISKVWDANGYVILDRIYLWYLRY